VHQTKAAYPHLNRAARKRLESIRLQGTSARAQTIKYADYLDNSVDILLQDPKFAKTYLQEIAFSLAGMDRGNPELRQKVLQILAENRPAFP
jgi:guanosine-3',5'-bis(diphosphate) 3'-pyrophosphohydrolase